MYSSHDPSSPTTIYFCSICDKPFNHKSPRDRHFRYCGRSTRKRPRSCQACNAAKIKCSFEARCARCAKKGIECVYDELVAAGRRELPVPVAAAHAIGARPCRRPSAPLANEALHANDKILSDERLAFPDDPALDDAQNPFGSNNDDPLADLSTARFPLEESLAFGEVFTFDDDSYLADATLALYDKLEQQSTSWCAWMRRDISLSVVTERPTAKPNLDRLANLQLERPHAQHSADLVIQSLRSFPTMMLRRETFPWFIHPQSQPVSNSTGAALPEALSTCMSLAQMFASRTSETRHILWRTIRAECVHVISEMHSATKFELLAAMQACMIYLIMYIVDHAPEDEVNGLEILLALHDLCILSTKVCGGKYVQNELSKLSPNWEDWIFAESQRRLSDLWFLVGCIVCVKNGNTCDASQSYRTLPLPSPKSLWEAPTQSAWQSEYEASHISQMSGLVTLGDLIDVQQSHYTPSNARKLDKWNAGVDNLGSLLNLVGTMV